MRSTSVPVSNWLATDKTSIWLGISRPVSSLHGTRQHWRHGTSSDDAKHSRWISHPAGPAPAPDAAVPERNEHQCSENSRSRQLYRTGWPDQIPPGGPANTGLTFPIFHPEQILGQTIGGGEIQRESAAVPGHAPALRAEALTRLILDRILMAI